MTTEVSFLPVDGSQRFCLLHVPAGKPRGAILYLHPFAEELNRSRQVVARQARAFADAGYAVLQVDLYGCGDSAGDFGAADWAQWRRDGHAAMRMLAERFDAPLGLWGLRSGTLLAVELARELASNVVLILWQPVLSGKQHLQQFLRLSLAADLLDGKARGGTDVFMTQLEQGRSVEVAGYSLSPGLAAGLARAELAPPVAAQRMHCVEIVPGGGELSHGLRRFATQENIESSVCDDAQCWLTPGVQDCPRLIEHSVRVVEGLLP